MISKQGDDLHSYAHVKWSMFELQIYKYITCKSQWGPAIPNSHSALPEAKEEARGTAATGAQSVDVQS